LAIVIVNVIANQNIIDGETIAQNGVHGLDSFLLDAARGNIGLVGDDDHQEPSVPKATNRGIDVRKDTKIGKRCRGHQPAVALDAGIDNSVTIEKDATTCHFGFFFAVSERHDSTPVAGPEYHRERPFPGRQSRDNGVIARKLRCGQTRAPTNCSRYHVQTHQKRDLSERQQGQGNEHGTKLAVVAHDAARSMRRLCGRGDRHLRIPPTFLRVSGRAKLGDFPHQERN